MAALDSSTNVVHKVGLEVDQKMIKKLVKIDTRTNFYPQDMAQILLIKRRS